MSETLALPPRVVMRDLMLTAGSMKGRVFWTFALIVAFAIAIAAMVTPNYKARSSLLVLMGTEHAFRPAAGQQFMNGSGIDLEQILRTEASILASDDLHRDVIREVGLARMYPKLMEERSPLEKWIQDKKRMATDALGLTEPANGQAPMDPMVLAVERFREDLTITVDKKSSVIAIDFLNPDKVVAAQALARLEDKYFVLRKQLYNDVQAPIVLDQQKSISTQLNDADVALQTFKQQHDISNFSERREILLRHQGDLEAAQTKAEASIAALTARLDQLNTQLVAMTGGKKGSANAAAALQGMVQAYRQREEEAQTRYRGSPAVDEARRQAMERASDIARIQSTQAFGVQTERDKTDADLKAAVAGRDALNSQITAINKQINALNGDETELHRLERNRSILEASFKSVSADLDQRRTVEAIEANRESSVRIIQPPRIPPLPQPTRRLILLAGAVVGMLVSLGTIMMAHFFRSVYMRPEALELDTGLNVLAAVPEMRGLGGPSSSVLIYPG